MGKKNIVQGGKTEKRDHGPCMSCLNSNYFSKGKVKEGGRKNVFPTEV